MPHPENRSPARVTPDLVTMRVWEVIEANARVNIACDNCGHETTWTRPYMERKLRKFRGVTMIRLALRLRCGCGSHYVRVWRS